MDKKFSGVVVVIDSTSGDVMISSGNPQLDQQLEIVARLGMEKGMSIAAAGDLGAKVLGLAEWLNEQVKVPETEPAGYESPAYPAIERFAEKMRKDIRRHLYVDPSDCSAVYLTDMLYSSLREGRLEKAANYLMMLSEIGEGLAFGPETDQPAPKNFSEQVNAVLGIETQSPAHEAIDNFAAQMKRRANQYAWIDPKDSNVSRVTGDFYAAIRANDLAGAANHLMILSMRGEGLAHEENNPDHAAVDAFAAAMKEKMDEGARAGKSGWNDPARCSAFQLNQLFHEAVRNNKIVSAANYLMMLKTRGAVTLAPDLQPITNAVAHVSDEEQLRRR